MVCDRAKVEACFACIGARLAPVVIVKDDLDAVPMALCESHIPDDFGTETFVLGD